ncbi:PH domain-containing protein [Rothia sp. P5766]|uniref:PH domain-containing protein n=1 Tax=Rothia sp. P5766 TaxID=3402656 RepID=UPI003ADE8B1D
MKSQYLQNPPVRFRTKTAALYTWCAGLVALSVLLALAYSGGPLALLKQGWGALLIAYAIWYLLGRSDVLVDQDAITVRNPFVNHTVNYAALIDISTRYHLTLVTATKRYQAFGVPASGMLASLTAHRQDLRNLPAITYAVGSAVRTSDLPNSAAGALALMIRGYWQEQVEDGALDGVEPVQISALDLRGILTCGALVFLTVVGLFL